MLILAVCLPGQQSQSGLGKVVSDVSVTRLKYGSYDQYPVGRLELLMESRSLMIDHVNMSAETEKGIGCAYFYFPRRNEGYDESFVWATLLEQLIRQPTREPVVSPDIIRRFNESLRGSEQPHFSEYETFFHSQVLTFQTVYLFFDALESFSPNEQSLILKLSQLPRQVKLVFSSRDISTFGGCKVDHSVHITPNQNDIELYVQNQIQTHFALRNLLAKTEDMVRVVREVTSLAITSNM
jgi:hypothetical protein